MAADGGRRVGAAAGLHEPRQLPARARPRPAQGDRGAPGARRVARVARPAAADGDDAAEPAGRGRRHRPGGMAPRPAGHRGPPAADSGHARSGSRRARPGVHARRLDRGRRPARSGSGSAEHPAGHGRRSPERERGRWPARSAPVAQRAGHRAAHDLAGAARRGRPLPPQLPAGAVGRPGLRPRADRHPDLPDAVHPVHARRGARLRAAPVRPLPRAARRRGGRRHQQPAPAPAQHELERLQRRRLRTADGPRRLHRGPGRGRPRVLRGGRRRDPPRTQLQRRRPARHPGRGHHQRGDGPAVLDRRRRRRPAGAAARRRSPLARRRRGERREGADARRGAAQHGLSPVLAAVRAVADGRGEDVDGPGADGTRAPDRRAGGGSRPVGPRDQDDGPPPRVDEPAPAALLRPVRLRGAGADTGRGRPLRRGQLQRRPADARDQDSGTVALSSCASSTNAVLAAWTAPSLVTNARVMFLAGNNISSAYQ